MCNRNLSFRYIAALVVLVACAIQWKPAQAAIDFAEYRMFIFRNQTSILPSRVISSIQSRYVQAGDFSDSLTGGADPFYFGRSGTGLIPTEVNGFSANSLNGNPSNPFWFVTLSPGPGVPMKFTSLRVDAGLATTLTSPASYRWDYDVFWNGNSYSAPIGRIIGPTLTGTGTTVANGLLLDLSHLPTRTSAVSFRIVPVRNGVTDGNSVNRVGWLDNLFFTGNLSGVPEPSSAMALVLAGALGVLIRRRG